MHIEYQELKEQILRFNDFFTDNYCEPPMNI